MLCTAQNSTRVTRTFFGASSGLSSIRCIQQSELKERFCVCSHTAEHGIRKKETSIAMREVHHRQHTENYSKFIFVT